ncbi:nuclear transport factor 2 family protein [Algiphilus sp.]|uniref:nuclear transport factor 2 family protein n=1 Tax=Algiphilus sp. TaxID=1872431 RepID=UPI0025BF1E78|nr:nuclear transport factor 2 family protein [Algiphilus sp.]MCK5769657.1 nuclear transport factor 2 family protein [Algiphilus sp.]
MALNLEAIELIRQLKYRYFRAIDTADMETLKGVFTEDATVCYVGGTYRFEAEGRDNILQALEYAFHAEAIAFHHGNHPEIEVQSDTEATGLWYLRDWFLDLRRNITTDGASFYRDRYVFRDGRWQIRHSGYERVWEIVEEVTRTPNITAHHLAKHGKKLPPDAE